MYNSNLRIFLLVLVLLPISLFAQKSIKRDLKRMQIEESDLAYSNESFLFYPRGFIYCVNAPDSAYYFGCLGSDVKDIEEYFNNQNIRKKPVNHKILRGYENLVDTIQIQSLGDKISDFKSFDRISNFRLNDDAEYVIIYYWCEEMLDRYFIKNVRFIKNFSIQNPDKRIQVVFVSTDKI